jgi:tape measure domain-containing protein
MGTEGFTFEIVGSADKANKSIDGTLSKLDAIAPRARQAGDALTNALGRAANLVEQYNRALASGDGKFAAGARESAEALRAEIEQLQREKQALDAIRGPVQEYQNELQAMVSLLSKGAINAQEFNARLQQIRPPTAFKAAAAGGGGGFDVSSLAGSLPGGSIIAGAAGGGVAGAAMAGVQMAAGSVHQLIEMADAYTNLQNRLKALTGSEQGAKDAFDRIAASAKHTRSDLNTTADAFVTISLATKEMGLSQQQVMAFTEHLNEDISMSGANAQAAAGGMLQLSQALSVGKLQGQDLKALIANTPIVAQRIAEGMGISFGKLRELAEEGKITAAQIIAAYDKTGPEIERAFGKSVPTITQQFTLLKNQVSQTVGELARDGNVTKGFAEATEYLGAAVKLTADQFKLLDDAVGLVGLNLGDLTAGSGGGLKAVAHLFGDLDFSVEGFKNAITGTVPPARHFADQQEVINRVVAMGTGHMNDYARAQAENTIRLVLGEKAAAEFAAKTSNVSAEMERAQKIVKSFQDTFGQLTIGINEASHALGDLGRVLNDNATDRSYAIIGARAADVHNARIQLDALKLAYKDGKYPLALYREEAQKLNDVINGVTSSSKTAAKELAALGRKLLGEETGTDKAIRLGAQDRTQQQGERSYLTDLDQKATLDSAADTRSRWTSSTTSSREP